MKKPTITKREKIKQMLEKSIISESSDIADMILDSKEENIENIYNAWVKRIKPSKLNLTETLLRIVKEYESDKDFDSLDLTVELSYDKYDYDQKLNAEPIQDVQVKFSLRLLTEEIDKYGKRERKYISSDNYPHNLESSEMGLKIRYNDYKNPINANDTEITL